LGWLLEEARYIDIRGLQVGNQRVHRLEIDKLYTPLSTLRATLPDPTESRNKPRHAPASALSRAAPSAGSHPRIAPVPSSRP